MDLELVVWFATLALMLVALGTAAVGAALFILGADSHHPEADGVTP